MSVSDDSKVKLIETKSQIVYSILKQIKDKEFQKCLSLTELKSRDPLVYELIKKYDKCSLECHFSVEEVYKQLNEVIKTKCIEILELITGQEFNTQEMNDSEIQTSFQSELDKLSQQMAENQTLTESLENKFEEYEKIFLQYLDIVNQYYKKYMIPFKLCFDDMICNLSMSKAQTLCIRNRYLETESSVQMYGNKETVDKLREERKALDSEQFLLTTELNKSEDMLAKYEGLDMDLLKEYRRLKSELDCRHWAINELNQSSGSNSNGSLNGLSD